MNELCIRSLIVVCLSTTQIRVEKCRTGHWYAYYGIVINN